MRTKLQREAGGNNYTVFLNLPVNIILMKIFELGSDFDIFTNIS